MAATAEKLPAKYLLREAPKTITSDEQHEAYLAQLVALQRQGHRSAHETEIAKLLAVLIADYEAKEFAMEDASPVEVLQELMSANGLRQKDLASLLGGESVVSLILKGRRELNANQIQRPSERFNVSPAVFFSR